MEYAIQDGNGTNACSVLRGKEIDLLAWPGDTSSLIQEMKRRAGCEYDRDLAALLGKGHTAIAQWRKRCSVPEAAILRLENRLRSGQR